MSRSQIKGHLISFVENSTNPRILWSMSKTEIVSQVHKIFQKEGYTEKEIAEILDELIREEDWIEDDVSFSIIYPKKRKEDIRRTWSHSLLLFKQIHAFLIVYIALLIATYYIKRELLEAAFWLPIILLIGYIVVQNTYRNFEKAFRIIGKNRLWLMISYLGSIIVVFLVLIGLQYLKGWFAIKEIIVYGFAGGTALGTLIYRIIKEKN